MPLRLIEAPAFPPVPLTIAKGHLRVDFDDDDAAIADKLLTAVETFDGPEGELGRALVTQKWALELDDFPRRDPRAWRHLQRHRHGELPIILPLQPVISVESVTYLDAAGDEQVLVEDEDYLVHTGEDGMIEPVAGGCWPQTKCQRRAVTIEFTAGYGPATAEQGALLVPRRICQGILLVLGDLYANREGQVVSDTRAVVLGNPTLQRLVRSFRYLPPPLD